MIKLFIFVILCLISFNISSRDIVIVKKNGNEYQYDHDEMRPYLSNDQLALDTEITYAKAIRLQMGGKWEETARLYEKIAKRGHPTAQVHLGKQYYHGNGVSASLVQAYKWFALSETAIGKHFMKILEEDMSKKQMKEANQLIKKFRPLYK